MRNRLTTALGLGAAFLLTCTPLLAHHGSAISYDTQHLWTTWATVIEFNYLNPHPSMMFERTTKDGKVEHWVSELLTNPSALARAGWTKSRSVAALQPGTRVKLYLATAKTGGFLAYVELVESEKGELICSERENPIAAVDMDGVPGGYQPSSQDQK